MYVSKNPIIGIIAHLECVGEVIHSCNLEIYIYDHFTIQ